MDKVRTHQCTIWIWGVLSKCPCKRMCKQGLPVVITRNGKTLDTETFQQSVAINTNNMLVSTLEMSQEGLSGSEWPTTPLQNHIYLHIYCSFSPTITTRSGESHPNNTMRRNWHKFRLTIHEHIPLEGGYLSFWNLKNGDTQIPTMQTSWRGEPPGNAQEEHTVACHWGETLTVMIFTTQWASV